MIFNVSIQHLVLIFLGICFFISSLRWWFRLHVYFTPNMKISARYLPACYWNNSMGHPLSVNKTVSLSIHELTTTIPEIQNGGWTPRSCHAENKIAIIIPYKNREENLKVFLHHYHPYFQTQNLNYQMFVIEQIDNSPFNKAKLLNIGFKESNRYRNFDCFVFHDVDLLSEDTRNFYGCPTSPRHMCPAVDTLGYDMFSNKLFGGVVIFTKNDFEKVNGFSNKYWGWGAEDDDMYWRVYHSGLKFTRPSLVIGRYKMLGHDKQVRNGKAMNQLIKMEKGELDAKNDGVTTLKYKTLDRTVHNLFIHIKVDLMMTDEELSLTTLKKKNLNSSLL